MPIDAEVAVQYLEDLIRDRGDVVFANSWDSGGMSGGGWDCVYRFDRWFWPNTEGEGLRGPCDTLEDALGEGLFGIGDATESVTFNQRLLPLRRYLELVGVAASPGHELTINGKRWRVSDEGELVRVRGDRRGGRDDADAG